MHKAASDYILSVKDRFPEYFNTVDVLDVGSLDINGNNRIYFENSTFTGVDIGPGKNVDIVSPIHQTNLGKLFDVVICTEMLEHDQYFYKSIRRMINYLKDGGMLLVTAAGPERAEHGTHDHAPASSPHTLDYYKPVTKEMLKLALSSKHAPTITEITYSNDKTDIYAIAFA